MTPSSLPDIAERASLEDALRKAGVLDGGSLARASTEASYSTVLSHIYRLRLAYAGTASDAPATLILKAGLADRPGGPWAGGRHEVAFYRDVAPLMPVGIVPRCFAAHWDANTGTWHLLLEDLTDSHLVATRWPLPPDFAQCEAIIRTRARCQAAFWDDPRLGVSIGSWQDALALEEATKATAAHFSRFADQMGDRLSPERRSLCEQLFDAAPRLAQRYLSQRNMTIIQGDAHVWNCFLPKDGAKDGGRLFDWDSWQVNTGSDDLACMMALQWYPELRQRFESRLLDCFHDELVARGVRGYDRRALQDDYRLSALWLVSPRSLPSLLSMNQRMSQTHLRFNFLLAPLAIQTSCGDFSSCSSHPGSDGSPTSEMQSSRAEFFHSSHQMFALDLPIVAGQALRAGATNAS